MFYSTRTNVTSLTKKTKGVSPPPSGRPRTEADFDAGAKYHVASGAPYAKYAAAFLLQFQIYRALCEGQGGAEERPLHRCTLYGIGRASLEGTFSVIFSSCHRTE